MAKVEIRVEAVIYSAEGEILLVQHRKHGQSYWVLPGGHLEPGETLSDCIERELQEELEIGRPKAHELVFVDEFIDNEIPRHVVKIGFLVELPEPAAGENKIGVRAKEEAVVDSRFYNIEELKNSGDLFHPSREFFMELLELEDE
jgi:ADP-ribose pyrophosphatase YjhB (NUDIX family)